MVYGWSVCDLAFEFNYNGARCWVLRVVNNYPVGFLQCLPAISQLWYSD
jgi:hypothetical protein